MATREHEALEGPALVVESVPTEGTPTPPTRIELGGKVRNLRLTKQALVRLEDEAGITVGALGRALADASLRAVGAALWAALLHEDPKLTREEAMGLVDIGRLRAITTAIEAAIDSAFPDVADGGPGKA